MNAIANRLVNAGGKRVMLGVIAVSALLLTACGSSSSGAPAASGSASISASAKPSSIAYFAFATQNSYAAAQLDGIKTEAAAQGATVTVFDAENTPAKQFGQIQDAVASGKYNAFLIDAVDGAGLVPLVKTALDKGIKVVAVNSVLGADLKDGAPQIDGISASVVYTGFDRGTHEGQLVTQACKAAGTTPCNVGYMYDFKASGFDKGVRAGLDSVISSDPNIKVVAEGEAMFSAAGGLAAAQTMLQAHPDITVIVGSDQGMQGATQAVTAAKKADQVKIIGLGGSKAGLDKVSSGGWFGDVPTVPSTAGKVAVGALIKAVADGTNSGALNPAADLPDGGLAVKDNVSKFTGEWTG